MPLFELYRCWWFEGYGKGRILGRKSLEKSYACVNTYGGKHGINMVDNPFDLHTSSINLTPWTQSLDEKIHYNKALLTHNEKV